MADPPILNMPEADAAYQETLNALNDIHAKQAELMADNPIDWTAYNAALAAAGSAQNAAQAALTVFQASILNTPDVAGLIAQLQAATAVMEQRRQALTKLAATLNALAGAADTVTSVLTAIAKFVAI